MRVRSHRGTGRTAPLTAVVLLAGTVAVLGQPDPRMLLPTGQRISPAGTQIETTSLPLAIERTRDGGHLLVLLAGSETPRVSVVDIEDRRVSHSVELADAWLGLTLNRAGSKVFVGGASRNSVWELSYRDNTLALVRELPLPKACSGDCPSLIGDVRMDADDRILYAADLLQNRIVTINTQSGLVLGEFATGEAPYRMRLTPDHEHMLVSHWGEAAVGLYRLSDERLVERIPVGEHPADILVVGGAIEAPSGDEDGEAGRTYEGRLFVGCTHADNLWTYGITDRHRYELIDARSVAPFPNSPAGSMPSALGVSDDGETLYIANAGNNTILLADITEALPESVGAIPTGWFPTAVTPLQDGGLAYLNGKGDGVRRGQVGLVPPLTPDQLDFLTAAAVENLLRPNVSEPAPPERVEHVMVILTEARDAAWRRLALVGTTLTRYASPSQTTVGRLAWLTSGIETDFFAKLGPAVEAGRLTARELAEAGRAAVPPAGTLWSNARDASLAVETYGIGGGPPPAALVDSLEAEVVLPRLALVRLTGSAEDQDKDLDQIIEALRAHRAYDRTVVLALPSTAVEDAIIAGRGVAVGQEHVEPVQTPEVTRTIGWLLGLRPATQIEAAARPAASVFGVEE